MICPEKMSAAQVASFLNVSISYLDALASRGDLRPIPGTDRIYAGSAVTSYKQTTTQLREQVLAELTKEGQDQDMGY